MTDYSNAKQEANELYKNLKPIIDGVVKKHAKDIDAIISNINKHLTTMTNKELQEAILQLSIENYYFAESKDKSMLMRECSLALLKEKQADTFNSTEGTQAVRTNQSIIDSKDRQIVLMLQDSVATHLKTKLDESHRIVDSLKSVLISRNMENKLKGESSNESPSDLHSNGVSEGGAE